MSKCNGDCFNCIYKDCIIETTSELPETLKKKRGRKPLDPEERKRRRSERSKVIYRENKAHYQEVRRRYYLRKKAEKLGEDTVSIGNKKYEYSPYLHAWVCTDHRKESVNE